jgi:hypothetical protein
MSSQSRAVRFHQGDPTLKKNPKGEIVSVEKSKQGKTNPWIKAVAEAKKKLKLKKKGLDFDDYKLTKGSELYKAAKKIHGSN